MTIRKQTKEPKLRHTWGINPVTRVKQSKKEYDRYALKKELVSHSLELCQGCGCLVHECLCEDFDESGE